MTQKPLKYLFVARFQDGSEIAQTPEDRSSIEPEKRSQFFDVLEKEKETALVSFSLMGEGHRYDVDLLDGHFAVDGVPFRMIEGTMPEYKVVFFRQHTHDFVAASGEELAHEVVYRLGWQCTLNGEDYQRVMEID